MTNKSVNVKRLGIYLLVVFAASLTLLLFYKPVGESLTAFFLVQQLFCWSPAIACIVTRAVTKEGFRDMKLHLRLKGNLRYYLLAFALPVVFVPITEVLPVVLNGHGEWLSGLTWANVGADLLQLGSAAVVGSIGLLGEELGWRGYMNQRMEPLLGTIGTCAAGGVIWGLWHFPNDILNWLNGYVSFPAALQNCLERMAVLVLLSVLLMWVTRKTGSVWPAVILHFTYNSAISLTRSMLAAGGMTEGYEQGGEALVAYVCEFAPLVILAAIFGVLLLRDNKKEKMLSA
ncbi:MAG: CPBP family intramembrane metalloprotease [Oscillospiraceae bacterium]|nr:CPBP family intramembrane metalloprotease [Oscillospiraceae bacterium]